MFGSTLEQLSGGCLHLATTLRYIPCHLFDWIPLQVSDEPLNPPALTGSVATAELIKAWLVDREETHSGLLGVNDNLQIVSVRTFQHGLTPAALGLAIAEASEASATGVVAYTTGTRGERPTFDVSLIVNFLGACESLKLTILDVIIYSPATPNGWLSARQQNLI
jgi:hypothetical protein